MQECLRLWKKTHRNQKRIEQIELPPWGQLWWFNYQKEIQMEKALRILTDEEIEAIPDAAMREAAFALSFEQWDEIWRNRTAFELLCDSHRGTKFIYGGDDNAGRYYDLGEFIYDSAFTNAGDTIAEDPECELENAVYWRVALGTAEGILCDFRGYGIEIVA
jgi:hypothetical protein